MKDTVLINTNGGCQIKSNIRKAMKIEPGDLVEIDVIKIVKKVEKKKKESEQK
jgi:bifunctional DNA-binding transcriptional regulator/antitoxin component of YhaV-PrlF toxin-antitoxin module